MRVRPRHPRPDRRGGFTLLELMVAMLIVAILSMSLYASVRVAFGAQKAAEAAVEPPRTAAAALDLIGHDLQATVPFGLLATAFTGTDGTDDRGRPGDDVQFFSVADSPLHPNGNGDIKQMELTVMTAADGRDHLLVRKVVRNLLPVGTPTPDVEVICRGVGEFNLRYYNGDTWADSWDSTQEDNTVPAAVEVTLSLERTDDQKAVHTYRYVRIFPLACSTAAQDSQVNPNATEEKL